MLFLTPLGGHNLKQTPVNVLFRHGLRCQECEIMKIFVGWKPLHPGPFHLSQRNSQLDGRKKNCWGILSTTARSRSAYIKKSLFFLIYKSRVTVRHRGPIYWIYSPETAAGNNEREKCVGALLRVSHLQILVIYVHTVPAFQTRSVVRSAPLIVSKDLRLRVDK